MKNPELDNMKFVVRRMPDHTYRPVMGPFFNYSYGVQFINMQTPEEQKVLSNASRYDLTKRKLYPRTKAGDARLLADVEMPGLAKPFTEALGQAFFVKPFPPENIEAARELLKAYKEKTPAN